MIPRTIDKTADTGAICALAESWLIAPELAFKLQLLAQMSPFDLQIYSGFRTAQQQQDLRNDPELTAAPDDLSTHRSCPATGADVRPTRELNDEEKRWLGAAAESIGLRWGGGAQRVNGIPFGHEWKHFDLGPRRRG